MMECNYVSNILYSTRLHDKNVEINAKPNKE